MEQEYPTLTVQQIQALDALLSGKGIAAAARQVGVVRQTIHNWINNNEEFRAAFLKLTKELLEYSLERHKLSRAVGFDTLMEIASDPNAGERNRVEAAKALINCPIPPDLAKDPSKEEPGAVLYFPEKGSVQITYVATEAPEEEEDE